MLYGFLTAVVISAYWLIIGRPNKQNQILDAQKEADKIWEIRDPERIQEFPDVIARPDELQKSLTKRDILIGVLSIISIVLGGIFG